MYNSNIISSKALLQNYFESHDPTQSNRQGNDIGTQYRSIILTTTKEQAQLAEQVKAEYQPLLSEAGYGAIKTEIKPLEGFVSAEEYHQNYLQKNPNGYCPDHATGVVFNKTKKKLNDISFKDSFIIGIFQIFALIPGSSRTGVCITAARFLGFNRICAAKYSMYLSIPAISGATFLMFFDIIKQNSFFLWIEVISVFFLSFLFAYFTISFFIKLLKKINFKIFVIYRIIVALSFLILFNFF